MSEYTYVDLVIGVPLVLLGSIVEETREVPTVNILGKSIGKTVLKKVYLETRDGKKHLIGTNENSVKGNELTDVKYSYSDLLGEDEYYESEWFHQTARDGKPDQVIIGIIPDITMDGPGVGRWQTFRGAFFDDIEATKKRVMEYLLNKLGYDGRILAIAQVH